MEHRVEQPVGDETPHRRIEHIAADGTLPQCWPLYHLSYQVSNLIGPTPRMASTSSKKILLSLIVDTSS